LFLHVTGHVFRAAAHGHHARQTKTFDHTFVFERKVHGCVGCSYDRRRRFGWGKESEPLFNEQGFPDLIVEEWFGFFAPAKTPASVVTAANAAMNLALKDKGVIEGLGLSGMVPVGGSPEDMARDMKKQFDAWGPIVKRIGFTAES